MSIEIAGIAALITAIVSIALFHSKQKVDRTDILSKVEAMHAGCIERLAKFQAEIDRLAERDDERDKRVDELEANWADAELHITALTDYFGRLMSWLQERGITPPEKPPERKKRN